MADRLTAPVIAGFAAGVLLVVTVVFLFRPVVSYSDSELIENAEHLKEVQFFLNKYPDAQPRVERHHYGSTDIIQVAFGIEKDVYEPAFDGVDDFGRTRELALILEYSQDLGASHASVPKMYVQCGGPISTQESGNTTQLIERYSWCIEKRLATNIYPEIPREEALEIARKHTVQNLVPSHQIVDFKETPFIVLMPENKTLNPLIYVAENGTHFLINETNNFAVERPCNLSDQDLCYTEDRDSQTFVIGHLFYVFDVSWQVDETIGGGTRYMIDGVSGRILYPPDS